MTERVFGEPKTVLLWNHFENSILELLFLRVQESIDFYCHWLFFQAGGFAFNVLCSENTTHTLEWNIWKWHVIICWLFVSVSVCWCSRNWLLRITKYVTWMWKWFGAKLQGISDYLVSCQNIEEFIEVWEGITCVNLCLLSLKH